MLVIFICSYATVDDEQCNVFVQNPTLCGAVSIQAEIVENP